MCFPLLWSIVPNKNSLSLSLSFSLARSAVSLSRCLSLALSLIFLFFHFALYFSCLLSLGVSRSLSLARSPPSPPQLPIPLPSASSFVHKSPSCVNPFIIKFNLPPCHSLSLLLLLFLLLRVTLLPNGRRFPGHGIPCVFVCVCVCVCERVCVHLLPSLLSSNGPDKLTLSHVTVRSRPKSISMTLKLDFPRCPCTCCAG